ncbi:hypothetical protein H5410_004392 [Solanum commersonii]|uniref:Uncharacterized protein n=1 Tax=Solanum commersonii TaxID=4109 RepID=A0A9J6B7U8_SOLCO|nr:hypothetical protein H5410_004392 [Solanum commersonii]
MYIGLVQVAFKPLTLRGLPENFIAALRDGRNHNLKKSLIGTIQTSLAYRPVYFNAYPNLQISLQDENSLSSLMLNVKLHGYDYMPGTEVLNDGTVKVRFHETTNMLIENRSMSFRMTRSNSSYLSPVDYIVQVPSRASTSQIRETYRYDNIKIDKDNIARPIRRASSDLDIIESEMNFPDGIFQDLRQELVSLQILSERNGNFLGIGFSKTLLKLNNMIFKKNFIKIL